MKPALLPVLAVIVLLLGACRADAPERDVRYGVDQPVTGKRIYYVCESGFKFSVVLHEASATLYLQEREIPLPRVSASTGARYRSGENVLWVYDGSARLEEDITDSDVTAVHDCRTAPIPEAG